MYKSERIQRRTLCVLYILHFASIVSISDLMRSLGCIKFRYICIYRLLCITYRLYTVDFLNIELNILLFRVRTDPVGSATS